VKNIPHAKPVPYVAGAVAIGAYFFWLSGGGISTQFSHDDLMNIYRAWLDPLPRILKENAGFFLYPTAYRPFGNLFYHVFFNAFDFHPLPYRLFLLAFLLANLWLVYAVTRRLSGSREIGALTALLHGYHVGFLPLYRNTGTCFDIFCFFFYFCALLFYIRIRQQGRLLRAREQLGFLVLLIFALNAKEIAVTLPVMIGLYEVFYHPPLQYKPREIAAWVLREGRVTCWGALFDLAFIGIKVYGPGGTATVGAYKPAIGLSAYLHGLRHDLDEVFITWGTNVLREPVLILLLLVLCWIAWRSKISHFRFALLFWLIGVLPVAFIPSRSIYAVYIPLAGFDLCAATLLTQARERLCRLLKRPPLPSGSDLPAFRQVATFALLLLILARIYDLKGAHFYGWLDEQNQHIATVTEQLHIQLPKPKTGARILFLKDPFEKDFMSEWATVFITRLLYRDNSIQTDRFWLMPRKPDAEAMKQYDYIFTVDRNTVVLVAPADLARTAAAMNARMAAAASRARTPARPPWSAKPLLKILLGAGLTVATALALGLLLIQALGLRFYSGERAMMAFVFGSALLSNLVFLLAAAGWARKGVFYALSALIFLGFARVRKRLAPAEKPAPLPRAWKLFSLAIVAAFSWYYLANALAPEVSPDGVTYHLGLVYRYARAHGFERITTNFYASLSEGMEMLFLYAFSIGKHSAAAMVHCAFLFMLPFAMVRYGQRYGMPVAGACGALLTFAAPVIGFDGVIAYNDVGAAAVVFVTYYLLRMWTDGRDTRILALAGLCAGFAYALKYPAGLAVVYGVAVICFRTGWKARKELPRHCAVFLACAAISTVPWMVKDWVYVANPVAPFFNRIFPNPYVTADFEDLYRGVLAHANGLTLAEMPWQVTVPGYRSGGLFGCVFLLAPIVLLTLRKQEGRRLFTAALVFALPVLGNKGARFLILAAPFVSLGMGMALARFPLLAGTVVLAHAITSWPTVLPRYCHQWAWHLRAGAPWKAALRLTPEEDFIAAYVPEYPVSTMLEKDVPRDGRVFSFNPMAAAYCDRNVMIAWWGAENIRLRDTMYLPLGNDYQPMWRFTFAFPAQPLYGIRVAQTAAGSDIWKIAELTVMHAGVETPVSSKWEVTARPFPWNTNLALDRLPITYWRADRPLYAGMFYQIRFGAPQTADSVLLDCPQNQFSIRLALEGEVQPGRWQRLATAQPAASPLQVPDLRRAATAELRRSGYGYVLINPDGYIKQDVEKDPGAWGLTPVDSAAGWRLYAVQPK
jgi:hypothetical protein